MASPRRHPSIAVLVSGGLDSAVLLGDLARHHRVVPIYVRNGLRWERAERYWLQRFLSSLSRASVQPLAVIDLPMRDVYGRHWSLEGRIEGRRTDRAVPDAQSDDRAVYLPGRNIILLTKAVLLCLQQRIGQIALGSLGHNPFPDSTPAFFHLMERVFSAGIRWRGRILAPYRAMTKPEVIRTGLALHLPLHLTFSCLQPIGRRHCGRCNKCAERHRAFHATGIADPTAYVTPFLRDTTRRTSRSPRAGLPIREIPAAGRARK